jgi:phage shock protein PspC (stress-responsive transcriptional regulator)
MAEKKNESEKTSQPEPGGPRRLLRSRRERMLWGVAGGLADYLRLDPTLVRLGFVVAAFFGGFGVLAYLIMAVVVPEDDGTGEPVAGRRPPTWALILLGIALLVAIPGPFWGWHEGGWWWGWIGPLWIGILILAGVWAFRALRGRPIRWPRGARADAGEETAETESAETESGAGDDQPPRLVRLIAIVVLALAAICAVCCLAFASVWATATGNGTIIAGVVVALGAALAATAFLANTERFAAPLLAVALVLGLPAGAVAAADIHFDGGIGERNYHPTSVASLPADGYELGVGQLNVDLRDLPWSRGQTVSLQSDLGIGQMIVSVPSDVCVDAHTAAKAGQLYVRGQTSDGVDTEIDQGQPLGKAPRLDLDAELQLGQIVVSDLDPDEVDRRDFGGEESDEIEAAREACSR